MAATTQMLYQVIPNYDVAQQIYEMANNDWVCQEIAATTSDIRYLIIDPAFTEHTETVYDLYIDPEDVLITIQKLTGFGRGIQPDVITDIITWIDEYNHLHEYDAGPHMPHVDAVMGRITTLIKGHTTDIITNNPE